jgi:hypothetical protein
MKCVSGARDNQQTVRSSGKNVLASCGPLSLIVADVLAQHQPDTRKVIQQICTLLATDDAFIPAIRNCKQIGVPIKYGPPATAQELASFAGEVYCRPSV